ncbi:hypothetical protein M427DRAFT_48859 [Gonapodya prolifera JEL478]|uniref:C2H2-type domain-containing protein n=1 Tax=Gonapodya prolifera (strain JEL478) TaxID=1344416 RepID=A0A138ZZL5_GONPJ|nr:hypothetical protein M427DRAFT_48859 [Gonapodya prolifera JEL478]|eukprot:KXS09952.1 hypothetical protein M427DRAFT_48859 [Gonapodya prolifera JEL478]
MQVLPSIHSLGLLQAGLPPDRTLLSAPPALQPPPLHALTQPRGFSEPLPPQNPISYGQHYDDRVTQRWPEWPPMRAGAAESQIASGALWAGSGSHYTTDSPNLLPMFPHTHTPPSPPYSLTSPPPPSAAPSGSPHIPHRLPEALTRGSSPSASLSESSSSDDGRGALSAPSTPGSRSYPEFDVGPAPVMDASLSYSYGEHATPRVLDERGHVGRPRIQTGSGSDSPTRTGRRSRKRTEWHYECTWENCNQRFPTPAHLERHLRMHTGAKPYGCPVCGLWFSRKDNAKVHIRGHYQPKAHPAAVNAKIAHVGAGAGGGALVSTGGAV